MTAVVEIHNLVKRYGDFTAVHGVSLTVPQGRIFALLGPNGAGKTSIIRVLMGILHPDEGEVRLFGRPPHAARRLVGYLPEERGIYRHARLLEVLEYLGALKGLSRAQARQQALAWLERFGLADWARRPVHELSHGMQQKAQLIVALLHDPPLLIFDEPFQGLDPVNVQMVKTFIREQRQKGKTVLLSSHQLVHVEALADEVALIHRGRLVAQGDLDTLRRRFARGEVAVRLKDDAPLPEGLPLRRATRRDGKWYVLPQPGVSPQALLEHLVRQGAEVEFFAVVYPSLEDIFLQAVAATSPAEEAES